MSPPDPSSRKALGRGLAALMPTAAQPGPGAGLRTLPIEKIRPNPTQPRKLFDADLLDELAASIRENGILQPILVRRGEGDGYQIIAGERRWRAAGRAGLQEIPVIIKEFNDAEGLMVALVENIQRADLDPLEEAEAYSRLLRDHSLTQEQVGQAVGRSRAAVANTLRLLKLPQPIIEMLADGRLTAGHARALMMVEGEPEQVKLAEELVARGASVRDAESRARMLRRSATQTAKPSKPAADRSLEERLSRALQTRVLLHHANGKGRVEIYFHSFEHLDALLEKIEPA